MWRWECGAWTWGVGGDVTLALGELVGSSGRVVGVDMDATKLDLARQDADRSQLGHVEFRQADIVTWQEDSTYDFVYCRFLLTHLGDPLGTLRQMRQAVRPGGVAIVEDIDFSGHFCHPACEAFETYVHLYRSAAARRGVDADIGPKLHGLFLEAGWDDVSVNIIQPAFVDGEGKAVALITLINIAESLLSEGLITEAELHGTIERLTEFTNNSRSMISLPRVFQFRGVRNGF